MHRLAGLILAIGLLAPAPPVAAAPAKRVLATGDSMMYVIQDTLKRRLLARGYEVEVEGLYGTAITKPWLLDWKEHARAQVARFRPDVTIVFLGASDMYPIDGHACCGPQWRALYIQSAREMMRTYGRSIWMTLPAPRDAGLAKVFRGVNRAIREAAAGHAELLDLVPVFTPGLQYRRTMRWKGKRVIVRQTDGVHIGQHGDWIASTLAIEALT